MRWLKLFRNFEFNGCKNEFQDNKENHEANPKIWFPTKVTLKPATQESLATAWGLMINNLRIS